MPNLTDTQRVILAHAAKRDDGAVLLLPASLTLNAGSAKTVLQSLLKKELVDEAPAASSDESWREDEGGQRLTLRISPAGLDAIGIEDCDANTQPAKAPTTKANRAKSAAKGKPRKATAGPRPGAKSPGQVKDKSVRKASKAINTDKRNTRQAQLIGLMQRKNGATIAELMTVTGWQAHSVRGAISGSLKKKLGLPVTSEVIEGRGRVYRITGQT
ncbi:MAG: DUF3489 domain-containing protein [Alphaproteobacteria bacterium]